MPSLSKDSAPNVQDVGPAVDRERRPGRHHRELRDHHREPSLAPLLRGLPGDSCQCPHWGYLLAGKITVSYADREETYQAGDAFYMTPGHVPAAEADTEFIHPCRRRGCGSGQVRHVEMDNPFNSLRAHRVGKATAKR